MESLSHVAQWVRSTSESALQKTLARLADPDILSLSLGLPDTKLFPAEQLSEACRRVICGDRAALQYALPNPRLKRAICRLMAERGVECSPDQVFLTMGAQQGLSLLARLLLDPGAMIFEEALSYTGFQQAIEPYGPRIITVPTSVVSGLDLDALEKLLSTVGPPALLYVMADAHNPLGTSMSLEHRQRLASLAREYRVPIIEDDAYGFLSYDAQSLPPIRSFEGEWVYYVGSFSKLLAPALRVGWLIVPLALMRALSVVKEASDINTNSFAQSVVSEFLEMGCLSSHLDTLRREYGARRSAMHSALLREFPSYCRWQQPRSGVFFWIELAPDMNATKILDAALELERVAFLPADAFSRGRRSNGMRLNFSRCNAETIAEGVRRISSVMKRSVGTAHV